MNNDSGYFRDDPIYAQATPRMASAIAVFRVSGDGSLDMANRAFDRKIPPSRVKGLYYRKLVAEGKVVDEAVVSYFPKGHGYTREESLELSVHGSLAVMNAVDSLLSGVGFRKALRGEFTFRALKNGAVTLPEAEAVLELIESESEEARSDALRHLEGGLDGVFSGIRDRLLALSALFELQLDYSEDEYDEDTSYPDVEIESLKSDVRTLADSYDAARLRRDGVKVALIGRTNEGKSTLFNFLLKNDRSIVSDAKGTTRDYIAESAEIGGRKVLLYDTAGLNDEAEGAESVGIERTRSIEKTADVAVYFVADIAELSEMRARAERCAAIPVFVRNKLDLHPDVAPIEGCADISSVTGEGVGELVGRISAAVSALTSRSVSDECVGTVRQREALLGILSCLGRLSPDSDAVMLSAEVSAAIRLADGLLGREWAAEETLDTIFSRFCVGK